MNTSEPLHVAFVWHMHQPDYRGPQTDVFQMPWVRLHALKDYLDMVELLSGYPDLHQTFNLVPSLVEQLEDYASGHFTDVYWTHTLIPAAELTPAQRTFLVERMCDRPDHPRPRAHPRYLELAQKRQSLAHHGWTACAEAFTVPELRDLQVWFNLAWFDPANLADPPLSELVKKGRDFSEEDKEVLSEMQRRLLSRVIPAYREAARRGQIELTTSPYFHPILPLLVDSDSARIASADTVLPARRFAHPEDAQEQVMAALEKHRRVFGESPRGVWCSEQAVGEGVIPLLLGAGIAWTISDETVLARSLAGAVPTLPREILPPGAGEGRTLALPPSCLYRAYRLVREGGEMSIVFRDHTLSDLIGFAYQSWDSREAAQDLVRRLLEIRKALVVESDAAVPTQGAGEQTRGLTRRHGLVTIALDGENAWEYYPRDGRDFLQYLYEALSSEPALRCVTVSEHLAEAPPTEELGWLHTGSWIGGDLRTWSGDPAHNVAWGLLHDARDLAARRRAAAPLEDVDPQAAAAWRHVLIAEGSDWFWWFGEHHRTELDYVWDREFRLHLQEVYHCLGEPVPPELLVPILREAAPETPLLPQRMLSPTLDGLVTTPGEWEGAGYLAREALSTMQRAEDTPISQVRFGWQDQSLWLLVIPGSPAGLLGLEVEIRVTRPGEEDDPVIRLTLCAGGQVETKYIARSRLADPVQALWNEVLEVVLPLDAVVPRSGGIGLVLTTGRGGLTEHTFHSAGLASIGWGER